MVNHANRSSLSTLLDACRAERIEAGTRRDGTAVARVTVVINILNAMAFACRDLSSARYLRIDAEREAARAAKAFAEVHDRAARGELAGAEYEAALAALRAAG